MDKKRILFIALFVLVTLLLGYLLYRVFFAKEELPVPTTPPPATVTPPTGGLPTTGAGAPRGGAVTPIAPALPTTRERGRTILTPQGEEVRRAERLVDQTIAAATSDAEGNPSFYNREDNRFYRIKQDGTTEPMSDQAFFNVQNVTWSPSTNESIIEYPDGANIYYNFDTKKQVTLPKHWEDFSFAPAGDQIAAKSIGLSAENRWLIAANPDGSNTRLIESLGNNERKVTVDWSPNKQIIALSRTGDPLGGDREEVLFVGLQGENFRSTIVEGRDVRSEWSPEGKRLLYSVYSTRSEYKPELWVVNAEGESIGTGRKLLNVSTWADKCAFASERYVYCGVPTSLPTGAGFAPALADAIRDEIFRIDASTGIKTKITVDGAHTIDSMFVSDDGSTLFFTDKTQNGLFRVQL
ncbi:MAG: hypothetical protein AAB932_02650 [Patescibacteria group bacterium]